MKMVASETVSFPSKPSSTGENNENESSQDKTTPKFKKMAPKHFMSPTISASSKAASRKKVLSERNDSDSEDHVEKSYFVMSSNSLASRSSSRIVISSYDHASSEPDKGYDPQRNYLSPRPKYLRFNPNRRHEIFNRLEKQDLDSSFESKEASDEVESASSVEEVKDSSLSSPAKENFLKMKNEENLEEEEEEEEEEEIKERGWCFKGVVKLAFTLVACFLSTSYICSMNSLSTMPTQSAALWRNLTESYPTIKKETFELIGMEMRSADWLKVGDSYIEVDEVEIYEEENGESEEGIEAEIVEYNVEKLEFVGIEDKIDEGAEIEVVRIDEIEYEIKNLNEVTAVKTDESTEASS
ncbi:PREDICTED: histone-lysine N-methyltransferase SETD1B-like [Erythranthe guttata]|uniref:histone-lysine N-methyltransferase SETD1B-like n=1 Tax=Erythranthe guttata TaxID=4155 RepID=UPI00064DDC28|nr:PREDICTED: histone-lysine N-methyltransferase SETD1B-like [Erythranthe guttata]|eukprot:XP_012856673.1 PREDICTED: histone-lysine N-methyltransferase SETD1B-like [Erythranthe guttata]